MSFVDWVKMVQDVGFPILVVIYLMFRLNKRFSHLNQTVRSLVKKIREKG
ncbi:YvrJ family protein [Lentibacillus jeotgali]|nr:YvrJ family protein [Lentibacillus jeotgali]